MGELQILTLITHGGPVAITGLLFWLYMRERAERQAAQALVLSLTKEIVTATTQMVHVTEENTQATNELADRVRALGESLSNRRKLP